MNYSCPRCKSERTHVLKGGKQARCRACDNLWHILPADFGVTTEAAPVSLGGSGAANPQADEIERGKKLVDELTARYAPYSTPRVDAYVAPNDPSGVPNAYVDSAFARELERELNEANETIRLQHELIKTAEQRGEAKIVADRDSLHAALRITCRKLSVSDAERDAALERVAQLEQELKVFKQIPTGEDGKCVDFFARSSMTEEEAQKERDSKPYKPKLDPTTGQYW